MKTLYNPNDGLTLNADGMKANEMINRDLERFYVYWLDRGYSPSELRELMFNQVFCTTTMTNALRFNPSSKEIKIS